MTRPVRVSLNKLQGAIFPQPRSKRKSKYGNKKCTCRMNHIHASRKEAADCDKVQMIERGGEFSDVRTQVSFPLYAWDGDSG